VICTLCVVYRREPIYAERPQVCEWCRTRLDRDLALLAGTYAMLPAALIPGASTGQHVSGTRTPPLPVRVDALSLLGPGSAAVADTNGDQTGALPTAVLVDQWATDWRDTRLQGERLPAPTVARLVDWLRARLDWACDHHPAVDEMADEVRRHLGELRRVVEGATRPGVGLGACPRPDDGGTCGGRLAMDELDIDLIRCHGCGHCWARRGGGWLRLRAQQEEIATMAA
jgi:hypothetical protein